MDRPDIRFNAVFASPIVATALPRPEALNAQLRALFLSREAEGDRYRKRRKTPTVQINIFESEFDLFHWPDPPVQELRRFCLQALTYVIQQLNGYDVETMKSMQIVPDCWFHITRFGGYISNHTHPNASWSGVYCVHPGESPPQHPDSGVLRFPDARPYANMYQDLGNAQLREPFGYGSTNYKLQAGQLILFPSYLAHEVTPFYGRDDRITVAFNCKVVHAPA